MNIFVAGSTEVPLAQLEPLLKDFISAHEDVAVSLMPETASSVYAAFTSLNLRYPIGLSWDEVDVVMVAGTEDAQEIIYNATQYKIPILDLTNWLMPLNLDYRCE